MAQPKFSAELLPTGRCESGRVAVPEKGNRRAPHLAWLLLTALVLVPQTRGTIVTIKLLGTWTTANDTAAVLDSSLKVGSNFVARLVYDNTTTNGNTGSQATFTSYYAGALSNHFEFSFTSGNYSFTLPPTELVEVDVDHQFSGFPDEIVLYAENYLLTGPLPNGVSGGFSYANPSLQNYAKNALANDSLIGAPWTIDFWPSTDFYLYMDINGSGSGQYLELDGTIDRLIPDPMPQLTGIAAVGTNVNLSGSNIVAGHYLLVASTNLNSLPSQWTPVMTNKLGGETDFNVTATNEFSANLPAKFYRYRIP